MTIWGLPSIFADCDSIDSGNFSMTGYLPLIWKDSGNYLHGVAVYVKEEL